MIKYLPCSKFKKGKNLLKLKKKKKNFEPPCIYNIILSIYIVQCLRDFFMK